jgi:cobalt-zinc-cadmium efflux system protein
MVAEVVGGVLSNSLALLADAGHMFTDVAALALSIVAIRLAKRPPTTRRTFGYVRLEILAALVNGAALLVISGLILIEAWERLSDPVEIDGVVMLLVATLGVVSARVATRNLGRSSGPRMSDWKWLTVSVEAMPPMKLPIMITLVNIQINATMRPPSVRGALSP